MKYIYFALVALFLAQGCRPICKRWLANNSTTLTDTTHVVKVDTLLLPVRGDTIVVERMVMRDTIITQGRAEVQLRFDTLYKRVYLRAMCKPDTIRYAVMDTVTIIRATPQLDCSISWWDKIPFIVQGIVYGVLIMLFLWIFKK